MLVPLFLFILSDTIASIISAYTLWEHRNWNGSSEVAKQISWLMLSLFIDSIAIYGAQTFFGYIVKPVYAPGFIACVVAGHAYRSFSLWRFTVFLIGKHTAPSTHHHPPPNSVSGSPPSH